MTISKPRIEQVQYDHALAWRADGGWLVQEKSDGAWGCVGVGAHIFNVEIMPDRSVVVNDAVSVGGEDCTQWPTRERWAACVGMRRELPEGWRLAAVGCGGEFLEAIVQAGGEGVVAKPAAGAFGVGWLKAKRMQTYFGTVAESNPMRGAVRLAELGSGTDFGWLALRGRFEQVRIGSVLKLAAYGQHQSGRLREARLDNDSAESWRVSF